MNALFEELRYALRRMRSKPGFAFTSVFTLALGIAANVTIFSAVNGIIVRPLPVPHPEQIAVLAGQQKNAPLGIYFLSYPELLDLRKQADVFSELFAYEPTLGGMSADNRADHFVGSYVSGPQPHYRACGARIARDLRRIGQWLAGRNIGCRSGLLDRKWNLLRDLLNLL